MDENMKMEISTRQGARTGMSIGQRVDNEDLDKTGTFGAQSPAPNGKVISLVPDHEPWQSPSMNFSPQVPLTSNPDDFDPQAIVTKLQRNKLLHKNYNEHMVTQQARQQLQEIIDS